MMQDQEEETHWLKVISVLRSYKGYVEKSLRRRQSHLGRLPESIVKRLPKETFEQLWAIDKASEYNQSFLTEV